MAEVLSALDSSILTLSLNRPEKQNAITRDMYQFLADQLKEANGDFGVRAVLITHEGPHFTAGNDLFDFLNAPPLEPGEYLKANDFEFFGTSFLSYCHKLSAIFLSERVIALKFTFFEY